MRYAVHIMMGLLIALVISAPIGAAPYAYLRDFAAERAETRANSRIDCKQWGWRWSSNYRKCVRVMPFPFSGS